MTFTPELARAQFSALTQHYNDQPVIFFDGPGGSQVSRGVLEKMTDYLGKYNANLGGHYFSSHVTGEVMNNARESVRALLNAPTPDNIIFGMNMTSLTFHLSRIISRHWQAGDEIIVTELDHYANVSSWQQAANDKQVTVHQIPLQQADCSLDVARLCEQITAKTRLVAVTYASNVTGSIVDIKTITEAAHRVGAQVYVDAVHYAPHNLIDVQALGCDFLVCSAYKFFGPHIGMAYIAPQWLQRLQPYKVEPATDVGPGRFETGTQSFEGLTGVTAAVDYLAQWGTPGASLRQRLQESFADYHRHEENLCRYFLQRLQQIDDVQLYGSPQADCQRRTPTFALTFKRHAPEQVARRLGRHNICVGSGHFYAQGLIQRLNLQDSGGVLRIGMMHYNTLQEIDTLFELLVSER
ncbi:Probable cysteine desulfurase [Serratia liquefaciens]|uniref:cysteine desulfurase-like protein n=1 Tax=Serratia TaxID=613 RepID=UPI000F943AF1|nr:MULTISPECIES: cysteine desulfurase-like protein [Serratia]MBI6161109.1 cysteine desulfurase-like protein [Serratia liquefaciens]MCS4316036.1 cysteine desulfurase family protein (TIGR01976 family) [Serratia sp. BIGb0234]RYM75318.1 cysteine desulfurase-like protein [Serratia liquefaciens]RYM80248.1 cysteine desulfurase-like protein [Serratia liquefaciens]CAI0960237.1 Probable cysteine desulfurase [Serratia liquefaciens]